MLVGTHALLPVCGVVLVGRGGKEGSRWCVKGSKRVLFLVGLFGVLPDLCTPHWSLEARQTSWSHSIWFLLGLVPLAGLMGWICRRDRGGNGGIRVAVACWIASALHLAADAASGGIAWLYPWRPDVLGRYYVPADTWIWYDAFFILLAWILLRVLPGWQRWSEIKRRQKGNGEA